MMRELLRHAIAVRGSTLLPRAKELKLALGQASFSRRSFLRRQCSDCGVSLWLKMNVKFLASFTEGRDLFRLLNIHCNLLQRLVVFSIAQTNRSQI